MSYCSSIEQFAEILSERVRDTIPSWAQWPQLEILDKGEIMKQSLLEATSTAFRQVPSDALITILTSKLRQDMRRAGFEPVRLEGEEDDIVRDDPPG